jgi:hypothetical protein
LPEPGRRHVTVAREAWSKLGGHLRFCGDQFSGPITGMGTPTLDPPLEQGEVEGAR